jgi:hypothetical protein
VSFVVPAGRACVMSVGPAAYDRCGSIDPGPGAAGDVKATRD